MESMVRPFIHHMIDVNIFFTVFKNIEREIAKGGKVEPIPNISQLVKLKSKVLVKCFNPGIPETPLTCIELRCTRFEHAEMKREVD